MSAGQLNDLLAALGPHWLELLSWIAAIIMAGAAVYALIYAETQISAARDNTKAMFLVDLDRRWEGHEMKEARAKWRNLRDYTFEYIDNKFPQLSTGQKHEKRAEHCSKVLYDMLKKSPEDYTDIMSILGFFETMGYVIDKGFISGDEIADLYGESIMEFDRLCWAHIEKRREDAEKDTGKPTKLYEHARNLILHTRQFYGSS